ncbi:DUF397 domain-containing protein [Streptomyces sp. NPDC055239]
MTSAIEWQKSSFSGGGDGPNCVEVRAVNGTAHLRESDAPAQVLSPSPKGLAALILRIRTEQS